MISPTKPAVEGSAVIVVENARKRFSSGSVHFELQVPRFEARVGEFVAVLGPSGCGKSTLLDLVGLVRKPDSCDRMAIIDRTGVWLELSRAPEKVLAAVRRERIGYLLQDGGLLACLSGRRNIGLTRTLAGYSSGLGECVRMLERLGLADHLDRTPAFLSGGQRQRMALVRAISHRPAVLLADEPTGAVDKLTATEIVEELRTLAAAVGTAVIMVTHDADLVSGIADRTVDFEVVRMEENRTVSVCRTSEFPAR